MRNAAENWAVVLAGADDRKLESLTTDSQGLVIPKQYCSFRSRDCLLQDALRRAAATAMDSRVCCVVAESHRRWWMTATASVVDTNVFVQPANVGTGYEVLRALLNLERVNPEAVVTLLPADHHYQDDETVIRAVRMAANLASAANSSSFLLATQAESPDSDLGYIVPQGQIRDKPTAILGFVENPPADYAAELVGLGALWNLSVVVGKIRSLLNLFSPKYETLVRRFREALTLQKSQDHRALEKFYRAADPVDFSRDILEVEAPQLEVLRIPRCGWTDLGTPRRVKQSLRITQNSRREEPANASNKPLFWDLGSGLLNHAA